MKVQDIMSSDPVVVSPDTSVQEIARLFSEHQLSGVPVVDTARNVVGMITEADLIVRHANVHLPLYLTVLDGFFPFRREREFQEEVRRVLATRAGDLMSTRVVTIAPEVDVVEAATLMMDSGVNPVPVVENGALVGLITRADIVRLMVLEDQQHAGVDQR